MQSHNLRHLAFDRSPENVARPRSRRFPCGGACGGRGALFAATPANRSDSPPFSSAPCSPRRFCPTLGSSPRPVASAASTTSSCCSLMHAPQSRRAVRTDRCRPFRSVCTFLMPAGPKPRFEPVELGKLLRERYLLYASCLESKPGKEPKHAYLYPQAAPPHH